MNLCARKVFPAFLRSWLYPLYRYGRSSLPFLPALRDKFGFSLPPVITHVGGISVFLGLLLCAALTQRAVRVHGSDGQRSRFMAHRCPSFPFTGAISSLPVDKQAGHRPLQNMACFSRQNGQLAS